MSISYPIRNLVSLTKLLRQNTYMVRTMVVRDIEARYMGSFLGFFWSVLHPIAQFLLYYFVFAVVVKMRLGPEYGGSSYAIWLIAGLLPWMFLAEAVTRAPNAVLDQSSLVKKTVFPSEILPIVQLTVAGVNHVVGFSVVVLFLLFFGSGLSFKIALVMPCLLVTGLLILGLAWFLAAVNVFLRDVGQIIGVVVNVWFFLTPIIYPSSLLPEGLRALFLVNPMFHVVDGYRAALLGTTTLNPGGMIYALFIGAALFALGGWTFKRLKPAFPDVL